MDKKITLERGVSIKSTVNILIFLAKHGYILDVFSRNNFHIKEISEFIWTGSKFGLSVTIKGEEYFFDKIEQN